MKKFVRHALPVIPALLLAACGGGGGGSSAPAAPAGVSSTLVVSSANAKPVAADGLDAAANGGSAAGGASLVTGVQVDVVAAAPAKLSSVALVLASKASSRGALATGVAVNETAACSGGGSMTISGNVSGGSSLVAGDALTITGSNCTETVDGGSATINGSMTLTVNSGSFSTDTLSYPKQITMTISANNLTMTSNGVSTASNGDMKIQLTQTSATAASSMLSGTSIANTTTAGGGTRSATLKNYSIEQQTSGTQTQTRVADATVVASNTRLGSNVIYKLSTPTPIVTDLALVVSGSVKVTGANSGLLLTVTTVDNFNLQLDSNGDGSYESTTATTTAELRGLL